jgi:hypothetical protein
LRKNISKYYWLLTVTVFSHLISYAATDSTKVWTNDTWREAKEGIEYIEKAKEEPQIDLDDIDVDTPDWNFNWLNNEMIKFLIILVVIILLAAALIYLLSGPSRKDKKVKTDLTFELAKLEEEVLESDFDKYLALALSKEDYRSAVRILFLHLLQSLHENNWIIWKKDKTNQDFLNETRHRPNYIQFRDLTLAFEIVWYGDQNINKEQYYQLQEIFNSFRNQIKN